MDFQASRSVQPPFSTALVLSTVALGVVFQALSERELMVGAMLGASNKLIVVLLRVFQSVR